MADNKERIFRMLKYLEDSHDELYRLAPRMLGYNTTDAFLADYIDWDIEQNKKAYINKGIAKIMEDYWKCCQSESPYGGGR